MFSNHNLHCALIAHKFLMGFVQRTPNLTTLAIRTVTNIKTHRPCLNIGFDTNLDMHFPI